MANDNRQKYFETLLPGLGNGSGSGSGGSLTVKDEGGTVGVATSINLIGDAVVAVPDSNIPGQINLLHHVNWVSHYNTSDGTSPSIVSTPITVNRYISNPGTFDIGSWSAGTLHPSTRNNIISFNTSNFCSFVDNATTTFEVNIYGADGVTKIATHLTSPITNDIDVTSDNIRIRVVNLQTDSTKYKANVYIDVLIGNILPNSGRFSVEIIHHDGADGDFTKTFNNIFYDSQQYNSSLSTVTINESAAGLNFKYLSGIKYYDINSSFTIDVLDIDYLNSDSYPLIQTVVNGSEYGLPTLSLRGSDLTGWTNDWNDIDDNYHKVDWQITQINYRYIGEHANVFAYTIDWTNGSIVNSPDKAILIDTWVHQSDELNEYFTDEDYRRLSSNFGTINSLTPWDSTQSLIGYDNNNQAQVIGGILKVPNVVSATVSNTNFSIYEPTGNPDYSSFTGNEFYREFTDVTNSVRTSCSMYITGFTLTDLINSDIEMWIFIPGRFTSPCYVHTSDEYNFSTFTGNNDPLRVNSSTADTINVSFGNLGLDSTHNVFQIKLIINNSSIEPSSIEVSW